MEMIISPILMYLIYFLFNRSEAKKRRFTQSGRDSSCSQNGPSPGPDRDGSVGSRRRHESSCSARGPKIVEPPGRKMSRTRQRRRSNSSEKVYSRSGPNTRGSQSTPTLDELSDGPKRRPYTKRQPSRSQVQTPRTYDSDESDRESVHSSRSSNRGTPRGGSSSPRSTPSYVAPIEFEETVAIEETGKRDCATPKKSEFPDEVKTEVMDTSQPTSIVEEVKSPEAAKSEPVCVMDTADIEVLKPSYLNGLPLDNETPPITPPEMKEELDRYRFIRLSIEGIYSGMIISIL